MWDHMTIVMHDMDLTLFLARLSTNRTTSTRAGPRHQRRRKPGLVFRLVEVVERQHVGQSAGTLLDSDNALVEEDEAGW